jgi:hypothetical protein
VTVVPRLGNSLLVRTTAMVLAVALLAGVAGLWMAARIARQWEARLLQDNLASLMDLAESGASAACYAHDQILAGQVVQNLMAAPGVQGAILSAGPEVLAQASRAGARGLEDRSGALSRPVRSPFSAQAVIGELVIIPDPAAAHFQGARIAGLIRAALVGLTLALGLALAFTIHGFIIRPITDFSGQLHRLGAAGGGLLQVPRRHEGDEIGQLVRDTNQLIERLVQQNWREQALMSSVGQAPKRDRGVFAVRGDGALEAWTPPCLAALGLEGDPPPMGVSFPALFGQAAPRVEACLERSRSAGIRVEDTFQAVDGTRPRWVRLAVEPVGADWFQGLLEAAAPPGPTTWDGVERRGAPKP